MSSAPHPYAPPQASPAVLPYPAEAENEARALKLAGVFLCVGALLNLVSMASFGETVIQATYSRGWVSIVFDLWIGGSLAAGRFRVRTWAMIRACLGSLLGGAAILAGNGLVGGVSVANCAVILLLIAPRQNPLRTKIAAVMYGGVVLVAVVALATSHR